MLWEISTARFEPYFGYFKSDFESGKTLKGLGNQTTNHQLEGDQEFSEWGSKATFYGTSEASQPLP